MCGSYLNKTEQRRQRRFSSGFPARLVGLALVLAVLRGDARDETPDRVPMAERVAAIRYVPVRLAAWDAPKGWRLTGAWSVTVADPRFGGLSALHAAGGGRLIGLTDSGVIVDFPEPRSAQQGGHAGLSELIGGPGYPTYKKYRDSEAMVVARGAKRPRLVTFEHRHSLWRFDARGGSGVRLPAAQWSPNSGVEAMGFDPVDGALLLLPEHGGEVLRQVGSGRFRSVPMRGAVGSPTDLVALPDGRMVAALRQIGVTGVRNHLAWFERLGPDYAMRPFAILPLGGSDNVEGLAAEPVPGGGTILWAITDNDGSRRTLLIRLELDATKAPAGTGA